MKKNILLYGVGTFKNRGVEAIINSTLKEIDKKQFNITIASHDYEYNKERYKDVTHIKHYYRSSELTKEDQKIEREYTDIPFDYRNFEKLYQKDVIKEIEKADICISVGGDNYCYPPCHWAYTLDEYAHKLGKKVILWGASLFEKIVDDELIEDLNNFDILVIRESLSYNAVKEFIPDDRIIYAPDPAFSMDMKEIKLNKWYNNRKIVAINLSPLTIQNQTQEQAIIDLIDYILKETDYSILLLPHVTTEDCNDLDILQKIKDKYPNEDKIYLEKGNYNCNEIKYIISKCNLLIAARTHASIAGYSTYVPTLVIGYSVKSKGIATDLFGNYENYVIPKEELNSQNMKEKFLYINKNINDIKKILKDKIPKIKIKSSNLFTMVIEKLKEQEEKQICQQDLCIGCGVCLKSCPYNAITMQKDEKGFVYPKINLKKCKHCNICRKVCPINKKSKENDNFAKKCYAASNLNKIDQQNSTSGGIFSLLAKGILKEGGTVYGSYMENFTAKHIRISKEKDLAKIRGSKYIQSEINSIFLDLEEDLNKKQPVLFCGTPCQISAVKSFLKKEYKNLLLVSVICHGVMSEKIFHKYLKELEESYHYPVEKFEFRTKESEWTQSSIKYTINHSNRIEKFTDDPLMQLYLTNQILRPSCYNCKFKGKNNEADIILGDFWGIEVIDKEMLDQKGVSSVIVNTEKATDFLNKIEFELETKNKEKNIEEITKYNPCLITSVEKPINTTRIWNDMQKNEISLISKMINYQRKIKDNQQNMKNQESKILELTAENIRLSNELSSILKSKRWRLIDNGCHMINRILRRK